MQIGKVAMLIIAPLPRAVKPRKQVRMVRVIRRGVEAPREAERMPLMRPMVPRR